MSIGKFIFSPDIPRARKELGMLERRPETYILERAGYATSRERTAELVKIQGIWGLLSYSGLRSKCWLSFSWSRNVSF